MHRERVSENVFWFQSEVYAQVTAGVVAGPQWAVVIHTPAFPDGTLSIREFIAHARCRDLLLERGIPSLEAAQKQNPAMRQVKIILPQMTFTSGEVTLRVGKKNLIISPALGHSQDGIAVLVEEDRILFAGDSFMPLPYVVDGDIDEIMASIKHIGRMGLENIVQGHGDIILRGEIDAAVKENLNYLAAIKKAVKAASRRKNALELLDEITIEACGKSRVYLGGLAQTLHQRNLRALLQQMNEDR